MVEELSISPRVKYYGCELEALVFKKKKKKLEEYMVHLILS